MKKVLYLCSSDRDHEQLVNPLELPVGFYQPGNFFVEAGCCGQPDREYIFTMICGDLDIDARLSQMRDNEYFVSTQVGNVYFTVVETTLKYRGHTMYQVTFRHKPDNNWPFYFVGSSDDE